MKTIDLATYNVNWRTSYNGQYQFYYRMPREQEEHVLVADRIRTDGTILIGLLQGDVAYILIGRGDVVARSFERDKQDAQIAESPRIHIGITMEEIRSIGCDFDVTPKQLEKMKQGKLPKKIERELQEKLTYQPTDTDWTVYDEDGICIISFSREHDD